MGNSAGPLGAGTSAQRTLPVGGLCRKVSRLNDWSWASIAANLERILASSNCLFAELCALIVPRRLAVVRVRLRFSQALRSPVRADESDCDIERSDQSKP